ncbi:cytochrome ubiquinol oxidase subunit I, partial [Bacillaceae bacterium HSR45]|nr:cytochrome ubiquinol oxidase subunit I [Bacillaceae bacterium HSR45]
WFLTEMGRQPWIVRGYLRVSQAATQAGGITLVTILFGLLYLVLIVTSAYVLLRMFRNKPAINDVNQVLKERGDNK